MPSLRAAIRLPLTVLALVSALTVILVFVATDPPAIDQLSTAQLIGTGSVGGIALFLVGMQTLADLITELRTGGKEETPESAAR
jgi:hypothetical protein